MQISIMVEGQAGLTWPLWKRWVEMVEASRFAGLFRSDHFTSASPPDRDSLECYVSLAYLADHSSRVHFGPLVSPVSFRDPVMLARQAAALDDLSGGRMLLGVGAGWQGREHNMFGYTLGDMQTRYARWEEGLEVITRLLHSEEPVTFNGRFYHLEEAHLLPRPQRPGGPRILVGGTGRRRTLGLAARYADVWNGNVMSAETFRECSAALDALLLAGGRQPGDVKRTLAVFGFFGHDQAALERRMQTARLWDAELASLPLDQAVERVRADWHAVAGLPEAVFQQFRAYEAAGVQELILQWFDPEDVEGAQALGELI